MQSVFWQHVQLLLVCFTTKNNKLMASLVWPCYLSYMPVQCPQLLVLFLNLDINGMSQLHICATMIALIDFSSVECMNRRKCSHIHKSYFPSANRNRLSVKVAGLDERGMLAGTQGSVRTLKCVAVGKCVVSD